MSRINFGMEQNLKLTQELKLTPEMVQSIRVLQMNHLELSEYISQALIENPVLEEAEPGTESMSAEELRGRIQDAEEDQHDRYEAYDRCDRRGHLEERGSGNGGVADYEKFVRQEETLQDHLMNQLRGSRVTSGVYRACEYMIGSLDEDGYLLLDDFDLTQECQVSSEETREALDLLQSMDPSGVGGRDLRECLKLQLQAKSLLTNDLATLIDTMLKDVASNRIARIAKSLGVTKSEAQSMVNIIRTLEPKPGRRFSDGRAVPYIVPDIIVERTGSLYIQGIQNQQENGSNRNNPNNRNDSSDSENEKSSDVSKSAGGLNARDTMRASDCSPDAEMQAYINDGGIPRIQVSAYYRGLLQSVGKDEELNIYLSERFKSAESLIRSMQQRNQTILRIVDVIMKRQKQFFAPGNKLLCPMTMQEVAGELGLHVSTVSRAIDGKYMQCDGRVYSLRHFFGSGVALSTQGTDDANDGMESVSGVSVRRMIRELIQKEDPSHPLSDQKISDMLIASGVKISRRTVAKYRENEGIDAAVRRRR